MPADAALIRTIDLDALFRRYHRELCACAYRRVRDRDVAADVVQEAFLGCLARRRLETADNPCGLLRHMVDHLAIDAARVRKRRGSDLPLEALADMLADPYPTADRWVAARQDYALVKRALDELPSAPRAALLLSRLEGLTHAEIGPRLGVSTSMVTKHVISALAHCFRRLNRP